MQFVRFYFNLIATGACGASVYFLVSEGLSWNFLSFCRGTSAVILLVLACYFLRNLYRSYRKLYKEQLAWQEEKLATITLGLGSNSQKSEEKTEIDAD